MGKCKISHFNVRCLNIDSLTPATDTSPTAAIVTAMIPTDCLSQLVSGTPTSSLDAHRLQILSRFLQTNQDTSATKMSVHCSAALRGIPNGSTARPENRHDWVSFASILRVLRSNTNELWNVYFSYLFFYSILHQSHENSILNTHSQLRSSVPAQIQFPITMNKHLSAVYKC